MRSPDNLFYVHHILDAIDKIFKYIENTDKVKFLSHDLLQDAVIRQFTIIGEAANRIRDDFQDDHPEISWREIVGLRNKVVHDYFGIDLDILWSVIHKDLPVLKKELSKLI